MSQAKKCMRCGGDELEPGAIQSTGKIYFRPENTKFLTLKTADIRIDGNICLDCGHIELVGDLVKAKDLVKAAEAH